VPEARRNRIQQLVLGLDEDQPISNLIDVLAGDVGSVL